MAKYPLLENLYRLFIEDKAVICSCNQKTLARLRNFDSTLKNYRQDLLAVKTLADFNAPTPDDVEVLRKDVAALTRSIDTGAPCNTSCQKMVEITQDVAEISKEMTAAWQAKGR